jgi:hypothetical protein
MTIACRESNKRKHLTWHAKDDVTIFYSPKKKTTVFYARTKAIMYLESQYKEGPHSIKTSE